MFRLIPLLFLVALSAGAQPYKIDRPIRSFPKEILEKLGKEIFEQDVRAALATDILMASHINLQKEGMVGWIYEQAGNVGLVRFIRQKDDKLEALADVKFLGSNQPVIEIPKDRSLTPFQFALHEARNTAAKNLTHPVTKRYNIVYLKDPQKDGFLVYLLAATTEPNTIVVGGHYRMTISKDGRTLIQSDKLFKNPMIINTDEANRPKDQTLAGLCVSTLMSDLPLETHVYLSLLHKQPFFVSTADQRIWKVENGSISAIEEPIQKNDSPAMQAAEKR